MVWVLFASYLLPTQDYSVREYRTCRAEECQSEKEKHTTMKKPAIEGQGFEADFDVKLCSVHNDIWATPPPPKVSVP